VRIVLLGPPGAGKGSLAGMIKEIMPIAHVSTGDMLRDEMKTGSALGQEIKNLIDHGSFVSDELVTSLVRERVRKDPALAQGYMLDGYPRTLKQAKDLDKIVEKIDQPLDFALDMEADIDVILMRLSGRRVCKKCHTIYHVTRKPSKVPGICDVCGGELYQRADDEKSIILKRMDVYRTVTAPIIEYYRSTGRLKEISGNKETIEVRDDLVKILNENKKQHQA
jgi:adenylate kinase